MEKTPNMYLQCRRWPVEMRDGKEGVMRVVGDSPVAFFKLTPSDIDPMDVDVQVILPPPVVDKKSTKVATQSRKAK